jgi:aldehyde decarbonylase
VIAALLNRVSSTVTYVQMSCNAVILAILHRDDQIIFNGLFFYMAYVAAPNVSRMPVWRTEGAIITALLHTGPVEFLYYWFHRALHHHFLYSRYHSHHHASIVTEPITCK